MIKIPTTANISDFKSIPDGRHNLRISKVIWKDDTFKLSLLYETENGESDFENYNFKDSDGNLNDTTIRAFSRTVYCATGKLIEGGIDPGLIMGKFIEADVTHEDYNGDDGKTHTSARFKNKKAGTAFKIKRGGKPEAPKAEEEEDDVPFETESSSDEPDWLNF